MTTAHLLHTLKRLIFTLIAVVLSAYVFVILLTYTPNDPSWSRISSDMGQVSNMGGATGAWLSDLMYTFLGWSAWWLIAIVAYEGLCIWWQRQQAIGPLRIIGYVFLLLASSGLIAAIPLLLGYSEVDSARFGGILGSEVAIRLSSLLSVYGSGLFLLSFALLTATFAFDIHWKQVFKAVFSLSWLGNGVRGQSKHDILQGSITDSDAVSDLQIDDLDKDSDAFDEEASIADRSSVADESGISPSNSTHQSPIYNQLKLQLPDPSDKTAPHELDFEDDESGQTFSGQTLSEQAMSNQQAEHNNVQEASGPYPTSKAQQQSGNPALSNVLDEFLVNSGLTESILSLREQEAEEARQLKEQQSTLTSNISTSDSPIKKQEPSFAWNDQNAIDQLLDEQALPVSVANNRSPSPEPKGVDDDSKAENERHDQITREKSAHSQSEGESNRAPVTEANDPADYHTFDHKHQNDDNDSIAQPHSEKDSVAKVSKVSKVDIEPLDSRSEHSGTTTSNDTAYINPVNDAYQLRSNKAEAMSEKVGDDSDAGNVIEEELATETVTSVEPFIDLTPTNTPPSNPKKPHEVEDDNKSSQPVTPTIRFATPEGGASNHIEDMVPDDNSEDDGNKAALVEPLPEIHDDAAFASSSRAMQTAKHRESLSPIPELTILDKPDPDRKPSYTQQELTQLSELLEIKLQDFNVKAEVVNAIPGPVVTRFEVELAAGVKASKVTGISRDLARSLSMASLRVVEVIPGKPYIGIEVPNKKRAMVRLIELLETDKYKDPKAQISMAMGKDIGGKPIITDLARAPHMLVAGTTGSGKSVLVNSMLLSMLLKYKPSELRLILIDPKQLELANYNDIPHLLTPVVTDMNEAASALSWCVAEMERRYQLMSLLKVRKLGEFNKKVIAAEKAGRPMIDPLWRPNDSVSIDKAPKLKTLPMIVIVADEFADMIMQVGKQAEELITRLAQKSRAAGIHLMLATQRPSVDVITGLIKANIPVRAALRVNSKVDSRTILDAGGAEDMLGNGDMLFLGPGQIEPDRVHGAYVSDEEVNRVCDAWRERGAPDYIDNMASNFELTSPSGSSGGNTSGEDDALYDEAVAFVMETRKVSASSIQRKFSIGYNRAARIVDSMEEAGLVSSMGKSGKRELLM